ncbi:DoxX family membrane protein [Pedobacter lithocola]|uniref:DoxX family membrane protein n=1 Tax=Pedobacter lithocola TaxID=1908239 RepID=A0ABV8PFL1_9SPHI
MINQKDFIVILIRLFLGYLFFSAGLCKLTHGEFGQIMGPPLLEDALAKYGLGIFAWIVAISQVVCGTLLMSQGFSTLGAVMLLPIYISIVAVTISMNWTGTPYVNRFFTMLNIAILIYDWHKLKVLVSPDLLN